MCDLDATGAPLIFKTIRSAAAIARMLPTFDLNCDEKLCGGSGTGHGHVGQAELLKLQKSGQFPDELVKIESTQIHCVTCQTYCLQRHKGDGRRGSVIIISVIFSNFVGDIFIK